MLFYSLVCEYTFLHFLQFYWIQLSYLLAVILCSIYIYNTLSLGWHIKVSLKLLSVMLLWILIIFRGHSAWVFFILQVDGRVIPGPLFDFGLHMFHNSKVMMKDRNGPFFYLPKVQSVFKKQLSTILCPCCHFGTFFSFKFIRYFAAFPSSQSLPSKLQRLMHWSAN